MKIYHDKNEDDSNLILPYKGSSEVETALNFFNPYLPLETTRVNNTPPSPWQMLLNSLHLEYAFNMKHCAAVNTTQDNIMIVNSKMQESYPGNYVVVEYFDSEIMRCAYKLEFDNREDQAFFILKYS